MPEEKATITTTHQPGDPPVFVKADPQLPLPSLEATAPPTPDPPSGLRRFKFAVHSLRPNAVGVLVDDPDGEFVFYEELRKAHELNHELMLKVLAHESILLTASGKVCHKSDTPERICFYEQDFYVFSNFSAFSVLWRGRKFPTLEHAYHFEKFFYQGTSRAQQMKLDAHREWIENAPSAHEAFRYAIRHKADRDPEWDERKDEVMYTLVKLKAEQHEYVYRKLMESDDRELVEDSWRDDYWGWGANKDGRNQLGKTWMRLRTYYNSLHPQRRPHRSLLPPL